VNLFYRRDAENAESVYGQLIMSLCIKPQESENISFSENLLLLSDMNIYTGGVIMTQVDFPHLKKLLVCTDGSPASEGAVNAGIKLGAFTAARVCLLGVINSPEIFGTIPSIPEVVKELEEQALQRLEEYQKRAAAAGVTLETAVVSGITVADAILEEVGARKPDWLIMGRKGRTGLDRLLMGSVVKQVIGSSPCPVLVVPRQAPLEFNKIMVAHDCSVFGEAAWRETIPLAAKANAEVIAVSVARDSSRQADCQIALQHLEASAERHGIRLQSSLLEGRPFEQIIQAAHEEKVDLIVLGSHGRSGLARLLMGSVAERVTATVNCPVLVVKLPEEATA
jgi:nucleotide-binding universal stress UspA family protein